MAKQALGRGLSALLSDSSSNLSAPARGVMDLALNAIRENPLQPRRRYDQPKLEELAASIREYGVVQPVVVTREAEGYRLVVGERRCRAARLAGLESIPALVREAAGAEMLELALIENLQRQDLNPIEEAQAFSYLLRELKLTQEELSQRLGCSRPAVANALRLLGLPVSIREDLENGNLSAGHARAALAMSSERQQLAAWRVFVEKQLSVRQAEDYVRKLQEGSGSQPARPTLAPDWLQIQDHLCQHLGANVRIRPGPRGTGRIELNYRSSQDLERLVEMLIYSGEVAWRAEAG